ncbi:MAG: glycosyltransferase [Candidatus Dadabacteria bacterium]|nr:glycosyltransferase [Candidatus Dadabacteria bacterium]
MKISILTGGKDPHYALGVLYALASKKVNIEFIANDSMINNGIEGLNNVKYLNLRGDQDPTAPLWKKIVRVLKYYFLLISFAKKTESKIFHILWLNKFTYFDRTLLNSYYKILGKKLVYTAHNIDIRERDGDNSYINKFTLKYMYKIVDWIFVHTKDMKEKLINDYKVDGDKISVIHFGINNIIPRTSLTSCEAKKRLNLNENSYSMLFFGNIAPYKGLDILIKAMPLIKQSFINIKLIIAGRIKEDKSYWDNVLEIIKGNGLNSDIIENIRYIPEEEVEVFLKASDVLILPYRYIFQSGVMFLSYSFGLPVIATDVGSLKEEVVEGQTGYICRPEDPEDLARKVNNYFKSELYKSLEENRDKIMNFANERYSWEKIGEKTFEVYKNIL